jgi:hypothetical protein
MLRQNHERIALKLSAGAVAEAAPASAMFLDAEKYLPASGPNEDSVIKNLCPRISFFRCETHLCR